jgi:tRNA modification GTPase
VYKSQTLLNALLNEERAIVSEIAGTTRDVIEETINIDGIIFRFIDTAGLRETSDVIEKIGVEKSFEKITNATVLLYVCDGSYCKELSDIENQLQIANSYDVPYLLIINKSDLVSENLKAEINAIKNCVLISAKNNEGLEELKEKLHLFITSDQETHSQFIVSSVRHFENLSKALRSLNNVLNGLHHNLSLDLISLELRNGIYAIGEITGEVSNDEILGNIFSKFCIGK